MSTVFDQFKALQGKRTSNSPSPVSRWLDGTLLAAHAPGHLVFEFPVRPEMLNPAGTLHGGMLAAMFDDALGAAVFSLLESPAYSTINLSIDYLAPVSAQDTVRVEARILRNGRRLVHASAEAHSQQTNRLLARAQTNLLNTDS
jgi:uncharacterized protein (TIGR00369 family)